ncbi:acyl carrier protein [Lutispora thermophila]|uniref:Acyl carrier protein n=1 Tax=Lutispora thermophila DSM 19022 TaxID=1122184 RepID=A0A1M6IRA7_9FIRM|nr:phosphopantetheine-binding protein [Lutispora thermophila]SHJ36973.1 acyl carrier protein [Lutispora thermophila DSM 19022]
MNNEIKVKLYKIIEENGIYFDYKNLDEIIEFDSLQFVSLLLSIEEEFNIEINDELLDYEKMNTVSKLTQLVEDLIIDNDVVKVSL